MSKSPSMVFNTPSRLQSWAQYIGLTPKTPFIDTPSLRRSARLKHRTHQHLGESMEILYDYRGSTEFPEFFSEEEVIQGKFKNKILKKFFYKKIY